MLNIAYEYSRKWQFNLNALKSCVLKIHSNKRKSNSYYVWYLDNDPILLQDTYNYLGILVNDKFPIESILPAARAILAFTHLHTSA